MPAPTPPVGDIRVELRRGPTTITVAWPMAQEGNRHPEAAKPSAVIGNMGRIRIDASTSSPDELDAAY